MRIIKQTKEEISNIEYSTSETIAELSAILNIAVEIEDNYSSQLANITIALKQELKQDIFKTSINYISISFIIIL